MSDFDNFYKIVRTLVKNDNTVIIIEHNLDIIKFADRIIDMGTEGGKINISRITGRYCEL